MRRLKYLILFIMLSTCQSLLSQDAIRIWDGIGSSKTRKVTLKPFLAENNVDSIGVIVCPGGSYCWLDEVDEGDSVAMWLQKNGINAFVLRYRTAGFGAYFWHYRWLFRGNQHPDMITDAQRALQWVREHAEEYHIDPDKVGMIGFSAGGHLVMSTACFNQSNFLTQSGITTNTNLRPDFVAPIYPVVTLTEDCVHKRSRRGLLGEVRNHNEKMCDSLSIERHIPENCPPVFLVNCVDDPVVDYHNSILLDEALTASNVNHRYIQFKTGGHGFGASSIEGSEECHAWKTEFLKWLSDIKMRKNSL